METTNLKNIKIPYTGHFRTLKTGMEVEFVDGPTIRNTIDCDWVLGGHQFAYDWQPEDNILIGDDKDDDEDEANKICIHESVERNQMKLLKMKYQPAHNFANQIEWFCRHHPEYIEEILAIPDNKNAREICTKIMEGEKTNTKDYVQMYLNYIKDGFKVGMSRQDASNLALYMIQYENQLDTLPPILKKYL